MNAKQARENMKKSKKDIEDFTYSIFCRDFDFTVRRASMSGDCIAIVTCELPCKHLAEKYILQKGFTIFDSGENNTDKWFRIKW
jgi:hypothetical protein